MDEQSTPLSEYADQATDQPAPPAESLTWQAHEYVHHHKRPTWFIGLLVMVAGLAVLAVVFREWTSLLVLFTMTAALMVWANKQPRVLEYNLDDTGISIGPKHYDYSQFKSFSVNREAGWHSIELDPVQRFMPRLSVLFDDDNLERITDSLSAQLPQANHAPDLVDRLSRYLRF